MCSRVLFCNIGWTKYYRGQIDDIPKNGGGYNENNIGHECYNFFNNDGDYYGYVQSTWNSINLSRIDANTDINAGSLDDVLVVWTATPTSGKKRIIGWYEHAEVYSTLQIVPEAVKRNRTNFNNCVEYNIKAESSNVYLIPENERGKDYYLETPGRNVWYADGKDNDKVNKEKREKAEKLKAKAIELFDKYKSKINSQISEIENEIATETEQTQKQKELINAQIKALENLEGSDIIALGKQRKGQGLFRNQLIEKYKGECCLCGITNKQLLIASHLKSWADSDKNEKVDENNGLLLCPNHDKLVDKYMISFDEEGKILISSALSQNDLILMNIVVDKKIKITAGNEYFIRWHRNKFYELEEQRKPSKD